MAHAFARSLLPLFCIGSMITLVDCKSQNQTIQGRVQLSAELQKTLKPSATLYLIARRPGQLTGAPIAVKRFAPPLLFPVDFTLSGGDLMLGGTAFEGNLTLQARVAQSGTATPIATGDIEGFATANFVPVGADGVEIELNHVRE